MAIESQVINWTPFNLEWSHHFWKLVCSKFVCVIRRVKNVWSETRTFYLDMRCADPRSFGKNWGGSCHLPTCAGSEGLNLFQVRHEIAAEKWCQISTESKDGKMNFTAKSQDVTQSTHRVKCMAPSDRWLSHIQKHPGWEWIGQACLVTARNHALESSCAKWSLVGQESLLFMQFLFDEAVSDAHFWHHFTRTVYRVFTPVLFPANAGR